MIKLIDLHKSFGENKVLQGLNHEVGKGESRVIIGGSGSGKSVILKHIIGILKPDKGDVFIEGVNITTLKENELYEVRKKFGMLFQMAALFDSMNIWENVGFALMRQKKMKAERCKGNCDRKAKNGRISRSRKSLSGGTFRRNEKKGRACTGHCA